MSIWEWIYIVLVIWTLGWLVMFQSIERTLFAIVVSFFIWPWIAWARIRQGDL